MSALARHRFSVDCDIVVSKERLSEIEEALKKVGYKHHVERAGLDEEHGGEFMGFRKEAAGFPVAIDLLVNSLVCRSTGAAWGFDYVKKHSTDANVQGIDPSVSCRVPEKELLAAFKIHSCRRADVRDIVMLAEGLGLEKVLNHLRRGDIKVLREQVTRIISALADEDLVDSLKGVFTLTVDVKRRIQNTRKFIEEIQRTL
ncbi:MAG: hypothetical protein V1850_06530 [Candidatus Bathyarchaeota archaeon]